MSSSLPFSQACENNKAAILAVLKEHFANVDSVLEIGAGTGQHAVFFAEAMPWLRWQATDREPYLEGLKLRCLEASRPNLPEPIFLDVVSATELPTSEAMFSANTAHIMSWSNVSKMFALVGAHLPSEGLFLLYGPFMFNGIFTSESNREFDEFLRERDPQQGVRNQEDLVNLAAEHGIILQEIVQMPANNHILVWKKS